MICEKPEAARRVSEALSDGTARTSVADGITTFRFRVGSDDFAVCSAQGHLYTISDPFRERSVFPIYDAEWYPSDLVEKGNSTTARRIALIRKLSEGANKFVNACDFDVEGETIGFNVLRYACAGKEEQALRARFSTLTKSELVEAFRVARPQAGQGLARAGRARHLVDFIWGVNLSRFLSQSTLSSGRRYKTVSIGRVQGPTLKFLVEREREIQGFVPLPYWRVTGVFEKDGMRFTAAYSKERLDRRTTAEKVRKDCAGKEGVVTLVKRSVVDVPPRPPFSLGDLQKDAYDSFGFLPNRTLQLVERLYLKALISYPRTSSQKLPPSIGYGGIIQGLGGLAEYSKGAGELLRGELRPVEGAKADQAHPAIHPTGERPKRPLDPSEAKVFDMVARRFLSVFAPVAKWEMVSVTIALGKHEFKLGGRHIVSPGWMTYCGRYSKVRDIDIPRLAEGDKFHVAEVASEERFEEKPARYNQSSLLDKMERERIGTKATRAEVIATLIGREYVAGERLTVTELGLSVVETMERYAPSIITTELTRGIEERLEAIEGGAGEDGDLVRETIRSISEQLVNLSMNEGLVGVGIDTALATTAAAGYVLGVCPVCKTGRMRIIRSRKTKKRFVGCTNYSAGCRASAPLPQRGEVKRTAKTCRSCSWPVVYVVEEKRQWRLCVNPNCSSKGGKEP